MAPRLAREVGECLFGDELPGVKVDTGGLWTVLEHYGEVSWTIQYA